MTNQEIYTSIFCLAGRKCHFNGRSQRLYFQPRQTKIVYCATRGENELFLAKVRCSARVGVEGAAGARDIDECENTSPESEIAFLPV